MLPPSAGNLPARLPPLLCFLLSLLLHATWLPGAPSSLGAQAGFSSSWSPGHCSEAGLTPAFCSEEKQLQRPQASIPGILVTLVPGPPGGVRTAAHSCQGPLLLTRPGLSWPGRGADPECPEHLVATLLPPLSSHRCGPKFSPLPPCP